ncbi:MAG TPA: hypothetical protein VMH38_05670 [Thermoplasmata archaeon]|nr:hypothetical protein [Thermoplasmata archaeon]
MQVIAANRGMFWAGVLTIVFAFLIQTIIGASFDPDTGASNVWSFAPVIFAFCLFVASAAFGGGRILENSPRGGGPPIWIAVERGTFWAGILTALAGLLIQWGIGARFDLSSGAAYNACLIAVLLAFCLFLVSVVLGGGRNLESAPRVSESGG